MKHIAAVILLACIAFRGGEADSSFTRSCMDASASPAPGNFVPVQVLVDPHGKPLACYQIEVISTSGDARLVGIEGGDAAAFEDAPYYDPRALNGNRIIFGTYTLGSDAPSTKTRVATLMFRVGGTIEPHFQAVLNVAATLDGTTIPATVTLTVGSSETAATKNLAARPPRLSQGTCNSSNVSDPR